MAGVACLKVALVRIFDYLFLGFLVLDRLPVFLDVAGSERALLSDDSVLVNDTVLVLRKTMFS